MYEYQNNILSIPAKLLYGDWEVISYDYYKVLCRRGKLLNTKEGRGKGNEAWVSFYDLDKEYQARCIEEFGHPEEVVVRNKLEAYILPDVNAAKYYAAHRKPNGKPLSEDLQVEKATNAMILNAIQAVLGDPTTIKRLFGKKKTKVWQNISEAVNALSPNKWRYNLPGNYRKLKAKYDAYGLERNYDVFIHRGEGSSNASIIKGKIAKFILAQYALPIKLSIPEVLERYEREREKHKSWKPITDSAVYNFLFQPQNERIWMLGRQGREDYNKKFKHTLTRDKKGWFPNVYWGIDGTKLDWIHLWKNSSNGIGAKLKIDVMFDVYSEKIIGWALGFSESHVEHFKAIKMAVNEAQCRPYYLTYDHQSGHKMSRMQSLYNSLVAVDGGTHHTHRTREHNSPAEQLFARLQQQVITKFWFSDGQGVTVKRADSKMNTDFVLSKKDEMKSVEELERAWETAVNIWNNKEHPHFKNQTRNEVYAHNAPMMERLELWDIMDKMWIEQKKRPITYHAEGLPFTLKDQTTIYEVYDKDGKVDLEFRRKYVGKKFVIRYDPDFLDGYIQLFDYNEKNELVHIANAEPKRMHQPIPVLMNDGDKERWAEDFKVRDLEFERDQKALEDLRNETGITPEQEMEDLDLLIKFKGDLNKVQRAKIEEEESLSIASRL